MDKKLLEQTLPKFFFLKILMLRFKEVNASLSECESILKWKVKPHRDHLRYAIVVAHVTSSIVKMQENPSRETNTRL